MRAQQREYISIKKYNINNMFINIEVYIGIILLRDKHYSDNIY